MLDHLGFLRPAGTELATSHWPHHTLTRREQADITLTDKPAPLYQLLVLTTLLSHRISADLAVGGAKALFASGYRTPQRMQAATGQQRIDALGRGHFRRYDESTATTLGDVATTVLERWSGDLRQMRDAADNDARQIRSLLMDFRGIGPTGADIFLREVQAVWTDIAPYAGQKATEGANLLGLPCNPQELFDLAGGPSQMAHLTAALVRISLEPEAIEGIKAETFRIHHADRRADD